MPVYVGGRDTGVRQLGFGPGAGDGGSKVIAIESPVVGSESGFYTENGFTVSRVQAAVRGTTPSVTWTLRFASTRDAVGTEIITGGATTSDVANGSSHILFSNAAIPADSFVWLEVTGASGTVDGLEVTLIPVA